MQSEPSIVGNLEEVQTRNGSVLDDRENIYSKFQPRHITIDSLNHGYMLSIGCQRFSIEDKNRMLRIIGAYLDNPLQCEKDYERGEIDFSKV